MTKHLDRLMAQMKADGITISVRLADPNADTASRRIRDAAERAGIAYTAGAEKTYVVCNRLLDPETNEHCEFDGDLVLEGDRARCPGCGHWIYAGSDDA